MCFFFLCLPRCVFTNEGVAHVSATLVPREGLYQSLEEQTHPNPYPLAGDDRPLTLFKRGCANSVVGLELADNFARIKYVITLASKLRGRSFLLTVRSFFAYSWSLLLMTIWFGLCYSRLKIGLVFFTHASPCPESWFGLFRSPPPVQKLVLFFFTYGSPTVSQKDAPYAKRPQL